MTSYASVHLDGCLPCGSLQAGLLNTPAAPGLAVRFQVLAGLQSHPVWALERLAVVVFAYCATAAALQADVQVNVTGTLVSSERISLTIARSIEWHTSRQIRTQAERLIAEWTSAGPLPPVWPLESLAPPVWFEPGARKR
jgi:hypothetical protein